MDKNISLNFASSITNYQAVNCNGKDLGIVEGVVSLPKSKDAFIILSTHHKDLFGNLKYAVPFDLCDIEHESNTIWLNVDKHELEFLYKFTDLYDKGVPGWEYDVDQYFNIAKTSSSSYGSQNANC